MNTQDHIGQGGSTHLLDAIRAIWATVGGALNDSELSCFFEQCKLPAEAGFAFLSFSEGYVTLTVPRQNPADWHSPNGLISSEKEKIARAIATKYQLSLYEPVDGPWNFYPVAPTTANHHFTLTDRRQTVIVAHPLFLKICLLGNSTKHLYGRDPSYPLPLGPDLLQDISPLYR